MERGVQRPVFDLENIFRTALDRMRNRVTVSGSRRERRGSSSDRRGIHSRGPECSQSTRTFPYRSEPKITTACVIGSSPVTFQKLNTNGGVKFACLSLSPRFRALRAVV